MYIQCIKKEKIKFSPRRMDKDEGKNKVKKKE
jgi:hypothetical protein